MRFRRNSSKFTGDIGESWHEYIAKYQQLALIYDPNNQQKLWYLHNMMDGDAKIFYLDSVLPHIQTLNHGVELIGHECNSNVQQNQAKNVPDTLRLQ